MPPDPHMSVEQLQAAFAEGIRNREYVVVATDTSVYNNPSGFFTMFVYGKKVIDELLLDQNFEQVYSFNNGEVPFVVLRNKMFTNI
jgi:hypothetical protein